MLSKEDNTPLHIWVDMYKSMGFDDFESAKRGVQHVVSTPQHLTKQQIDNSRVYWKYHEQFFEETKTPKDDFHLPQKFHEWACDKGIVLPPLLYK